MKRSVCNKAYSKNCDTNCARCKPQTDSWFCEPYYCTNIDAVCSCVEYDNSWSYDEIYVLRRLKDIYISCNFDNNSVLTWKEISEILTKIFKKYRSPYACQKKFLRSLS